MRRALIGFIVVLMLMLSLTAGAQELADKLAVGFQITSHFSGFSFKYQLNDDQILQPIFYISAEGDAAANKVMDSTLAIRVLYDMGTNGSYQQYLGWGVGTKTDKTYDSGILTNEKTSYAVQGFVGLETAKSGSPLATSVELSLGLAEDKSESGDYKAGFGLGLGIHYHF